jgi:hypothetical protein
MVTFPANKLKEGRDVTLFAAIKRKTGAAKQNAIIYVNH